MEVDRTNESRHRFTLLTEDTGLGSNRTVLQVHPGAEMADRSLLGLKREETFVGGGCQVASNTGDGANKIQVRVKTEGTNTCAKMDDQFLFKAKVADQPFLGTKINNSFFSGVKMEEKLVDQLFCRAKAEEQLLFGAKMEEQCLRAMLWQDMSVNLASTLLHQLSGTF